MEAMADRLTAETAGGPHWGSTGRGMVAGCRPGQEQTGPPKGGGRMRMLGGDSTVFLFFFFVCVCVCVEESLHAHRCQSCQQPERRIKQTTGELRVHSTSYDKGICFAMA